MKIFISAIAGFCMACLFLSPVSVRAEMSEREALIAKMNSTASPAPWPDPLVSRDGTRITDAATFVGRRQPEILRMFEDEVFGRTPRTKLPMTVEQGDEQPALDGLALRKQIKLVFHANGIERTVPLLIYRPANADKPVPVIIGLNFFGNQAVTNDPGAPLNPLWMPDPALHGTPIAKELSGHIRRDATDQSRGIETMWWDVPQILKAGYAVVTAYAGDFEPDFSAGIGYGIRPLFIDPQAKLVDSNGWGALGAWAWGMSRMLDYVETDKSLDASRAVAYGFSRMGKAGLWAAAQDKRFVLVISSESGQGGATLSHREVDEPISHMNIAFPYWMSARYHRYTDHPQDLPVDGHLLLSLIAPRPVYVGSAAGDPYSDPAGEFLSARAVTPVYRLFGEEGIETGTLPEFGVSIGGDVGYHIRDGGHSTTPLDWKLYLAFCDRHLGRN